tara:strand:+ start:1109 stop:1372 length:264 start_codon:yes stop_codon:yes gene_type:complete
MATTRSLQPVEDLIQARDALQESYNKAALTPMNQYSLQDRQVILEQRRFLRQEIDRYNRKIGLATKEINATGVNKADLFNFRRGDLR